jgi:two-component system LytT family response regulator
MEKIRVLIVDDEPIARWGIRSHLEGEREIEIVGECANGMEAVIAIEEQAPDLVFLDIQMPGLDGFGVLEAIGVERMPEVIFVTAYDKYALKAFEAHALDYLLKPFNRERFLSALLRARENIGHRRSAEIKERLLALLRDHQNKPAYLERLVVKSGGRIFFLDVEELDWIESADNYVRLHAGGQSHLLRETMTNLEAKLDPKHFLRVRQSAIVNIKRIRELRPLFNGEYAILLQDGRELTSSRRYRKNLNALLGG